MRISIFLLSLTIWMGACGKLGPGSDSQGGSRPILVFRSTSDVYTFEFRAFPQLLRQGGSAQVRVFATSGIKDVVITRTGDQTATVVTTDGLTTFVTEVQPIGIRSTIP